jgi:hypothetical protein
LVLGIFCKDKDLVVETFVGARLVDEPLLAERFVAGQFCSFFIAWRFMVGSFCGHVILWLDILLLDIL